MQYRIGVIGTGSIAAAHAQALLRMADKAQICAVCDIDEEKAVQFAGRFCGTVYTDYRELVLRENPDAVLVCLPHGLHRDCTVFCAAHGTHIFVEKPMANTVAECAEMLAAARQHGVQLMVGHLQRYFPHIRLAKQVIQSGELGDLVFVSEVRTIDYFTDSRPRWFFDKKLAGGGILMNYGAHSFDKLGYLVDSRVKTIQSVVGQKIPGISVDGHAQILAAYENGVTATVSFSGYPSPAYDETLFYFTGGALRINSASQVFYSQGGEWQEIPQLATEDPFDLMWQAFVHAIETGQTPEIDGNNGMEILRALEMVYQGTETVE